MTDLVRSENESEDESFFLELERACKQLLVTDARASSADLKLRFEDLRKASEPQKLPLSIASRFGSRA